MKISFKPRSFLSLFLAFQLAASPFVAATSWASSGTAPVNNNNNGDEISALQREFDVAAQRVENGESLPLSDPFHVTGQWVEIYDGEDHPVARYFLDSPKIELPKLAYTSLRAYLDQDRKTLVIEAQRGTNERGENGVLVARQYIPNFDAKAIAWDNEILSIIDKSGKLHAIDWGYVVSQAFHSPVPVFCNLWTPQAPEDLTNDDVTAVYITSGVKPFKMSDVAEGAVLPRNSKGEVEVSAGDLMVLAKQPGQQESKVIGIYSRNITHERINEGSKILEIEAAIVAKDSEYTDLLSNELAKEEARSEEFQQNLNALQNKVSDPVVSLTLQALGKEQIEALRDRAAHHDGLKKRDRDWFTLEEWSKRFEDIYNRASAENPELNPAQLARDWQKYVPRPEGSKETAEESVLSTPAWFYKAFAAGIGAITLYLASPALYEHSAALQQIGVLNWIYSHAYPSVVMDSAYRFPTLIMHTLSLMAIWPAAVGVSMLASKTLKALDRMVQQSSSALSQKIRDLRKRWADLTNWQRITSFGMRQVYSELVLGFWITGIERIGRQKTFFSALKNGVNPLSRIQPDSELGQQVGLTKPAFLGLNNPFLSNGQMAEAVSKRIAMQSALKEKKKRLESHAWLLAAVAVADQYDIDLSTLLTAENLGRTPRAEDLKALLQDPKAKQDWELLTAQIHSELTALPFDAANGELKNIDAELLKKQIQMAKDAAAKLKAQSGTAKYLKELKLRSKKIALARVDEIMNLGRDNFTFLKNTFTDRFVSTQVEREFGMDHFQVVYLIALTGPRADLTRPDLLAAADNPAMLYTSPQNWTDIGMNTYIHFFVAGSRLALVYQAIKPTDETVYDPIEDIQFAQAMSRQGFFSGTWKAVKDLASPFKSDLGGILWKQTKRQLTTIQAYIAMAFATRMGLGHQNFHDAAFATMLYWLAGTWFYGWVWLPIQAATRYQGQHFEEVNHRLAAAKRHIMWSFRQSDPELAQKYLSQGLSEMKSLYEELNPKAVENVFQGDPNEQARRILEIAKTNPPQAKAPNTMLLWLLPFIGGLVSTRLAIPLSVLSFDPSALNWSTIAEWTAISVGATGAAYWGLSQRAWSIYWPYYEKIKNLFRGNRCEQLLVGESTAESAAESAVGQEPVITEGVPSNLPPSGH